MITRCFRSALVCCSLVVLLNACRESAKSDAGGAAPAVEMSGATAEGAKAEPKADDEGLSLKAEEVAKLGVATEALKDNNHVPESSGYGVVMAHETIAQALADVRSAAAMTRQSQAALERAKRLVGTPGAMPVDALEAAERQATVDSVALELARHRLTSTLGQHAPWKDNANSPELSALASGEAKLIRVTFPTDSLLDVSPKQISLGRIGVGQTAKRWESHAVWSAPADATIPGRSFFAISKGADIGEGERVLAWTPIGEPIAGVLLPAAAALISNGRYWCYVEEKPGHYVRTEFDPAVPVSEGYFVKGGLEAGDKVVVTAAGQLLARELNPSTEAE